MALPVLGALLSGAMASVRGTTAALGVAARTSGRGLANAATNSARRLPRPHETAEIQNLRKRLRSPMLTAEQRQTDRRRLAQSLIEGRQARRREQSDEDDRDQKRRESNPYRILHEQMRRSSRAVGGAALKTGAFTTGIVAATVAINRLARSANNAAIDQLRTVSPGIAGVAARRDLFELKFQARRGQLVAAGTERLAEKIMGMRSKAQPIQALMENATNGIMGAFVSVADYAFSKLEAIGFMSLVKSANEWFGADDAEPNVGHLLNTLNGVLKNGLHNDPNLNNRRPNERPGGRM